MPSHWAVSGAANDIANPRVNIEHFIGIRSEGWWRMVEVGGGGGGNLHQPPPTSTTSITCFSSVHPHRADRHTRERVIPQAARDARVEHLGQAEIDAHPETEHEIGWEVTDDKRHG